MALDSLLAAIAADGRAEIDRVRHDAERAAAERLQEARDTAARIEAETGLDPGVVAEARRRRSAADGDARRIRGAAHEDAWRRVHHDLTGLVAGLRHDPGYPRLLEQLLAEALTAVPDPQSLQVHAADLDLATAITAERCPAVGVEGGLDGTGVEVTDATGQVRARSTVEGRLAAAEPLLRRRLRDHLHPTNCADADAA